MYTRYESREGRRLLEFTIKFICLLCTYGRWLRNLTSRDIRVQAVRFVLNGQQLREILRIAYLYLIIEKQKTVLNGADDLNYSYWHINLLVVRTLCAVFFKS